MPCIFFFEGRLKDVWRTDDNSPESCISMLPYFYRAQIFLELPVLFGVVDKVSPIPFEILTKSNIFPDNDILSNQCWLDQGYLSDR